MKTIYFDCFSGISGNMVLGALLELGLPLDVLRTELKKIAVDGYEIKFSHVDKRGIHAAYVDVEAAQADQPHRHLHDIEALIDASTLSDAVKAGSKRVFATLAQAEAKVHGTSPESVHFHEVGAVDAIVDIVGTVIGLNYLGIEKVYASRVNVGSGYVTCQHGTMPVPAPATAELLRGIPFYAALAEKELTTPTGAALLKTLADGVGPMPDGFVADKIGYGAGSWELPQPNVLRAYVGGMTEEDGSCLLMETNIDDMNPECFQYVMQRLFAAGAMDVWLTPIMMKKDRPATQLSVLGEQNKMEPMLDIIFRETSSLGVRYLPLQRRTAARRLITVRLPWGDVRVKVAAYHGHTVNFAPEYDDCRSLAEKSGVALKEIYRQALCAAQEQDGSPKG